MQRFLRLLAVFCIVALVAAIGIFLDRKPLAEQIAQYGTNAMYSPDQRQASVAGYYISVAALLDSSNILIREQAAMRLRQTMDCGQWIEKTNDLPSSGARNPTFYNERAECFEKIGDDADAYRSLKNSIDMNMEPPYSSLLPVSSRPGGAQARRDYWSAMYVNQASLELMRHHARLAQALYADAIRISPHRAMQLTARKHSALHRLAIIGPREWDPIAARTAQK